MLYRWPGALPKKSKTLKGIRFSLQHFSAAGIKRLKNQSLKTTTVTHAFELAIHITGKDALGMFFTNNGFNLKSPAQLPRNATVTHSFETL
uniref:Uncharacterized protein n=1 Tax=Octopus bimaculoides TaxID=37653 RepID=A0A0L8G0K4_OCTBM